MRFGGVRPCSSGDIKMSPFGFVDELLDENSAHYRSCLSTRAYVLDICDVGFDLFAVFGADRKLPETFACVFRTRDDLVNERLIVAHDSGRSEEHTSELQSRFGI